MSVLEEYLSKCSDKTIQQIATISSILANVKWKSVSFVMNTEPIPSHRPRLCGYRVYVPGAAKNQAYFNKKILPTLNGLFISTPCKVDLDIYCRTPKSFTKTQTALCEMKLMQPYGNIGDVDNFAKAVLDMFQPNEKRGHVGIMANDCLVCEMNTRKYYSMNPRYEVTLTYMESIPAELYKILRLKGDDHDEFN